MGSLTSRPDIPRVQQQPVIVTIPGAPASATSSPAPAPETTVTQEGAPPQTATPVAPEPAAGAADNSSAPAAGGSSNEEAQRLAREDNLLRRSRGRLGTVLTGFSGLLTDTVGKAQRKTLLGE